MMETFITAGQWLGVFVFVYCACLVINCAANELRNMPRDLGPLTVHDWDAPDRVARNAQRVDS